MQWIWKIPNLKKKILVSNKIMNSVHFVAKDKELEVKKDLKKVYMV